MNKNRLKNIALAITSLIITLVVLNFLFGKFSAKGQKDERNKNISLNDSINRANKNFAVANPHGFTDVLRSRKKQPGTYRIVVLGDSFIWGDGLPYEKVWSHKLEKMLLEKYDSIEVMHWGINGWSTKDQLNFLKTDGTGYEFDLLILGWVNNDPDMGNYKQIMSYNYRHTFRFFYRVFPSLAGKVLDDLYAKSYQHWINQLYSEENLSRYGAVLDSLRQQAVEKNAEIFCVLTPSCISPTCHTEYEWIKPTLTKLNMEYLDVFDTCVAKLSHHTTVELMANPENYHPGDLMTTIFAEETMQYLKQHYAGKLKPKSKPL